MKQHLKSLAKFVLPAAAYEHLLAQKEALKYAIWGARPIRSPDRHFLEGPVFDHLNAIAPKEGRLLFIGVTHYTAHYYEQLQYDVDTIDIDPDFAPHGNGARHVVGSALELTAHFEANSYDIVIASGLLGYGINTGESARILIEQCAAMLREGGLCILGYNDNSDHVDTDLTPLIASSPLVPHVPDIVGVSASKHLANVQNDHSFEFLIKS